LRNTEHSAIVYEHGSRPRTGQPPPAIRANVGQDMTKWLNKAQAAEYLGIHPTTLMRWARQGRIKKHRVGRLVRFRLEDLEALIREEDE